MSTLEKFAEELKEKREKLGISINDVYEITRIDKNYLKEMENGNFEIMPDVYMRAFIRKYADAVECNPEEIIKKYEAAKGGKTISDSESKVPADTSDENNEPESNKIFGEEEPKKTNTSEKNYSPLFIIGFIVVAMLIGGFYFLFIYSNSNEIIVEQRVEDILNERNNKTEESRFEVKKKKVEAVEKANTSPKKNLKASISKNDSLSLKINALDTVWFRTQIDKTKKDEFILNPNRSKTLNAKTQIDILIGNTGGIEFILNGKKLDFKGKKGEIRKVTVDIDGVHYSKVKTPSENE